MTKSTTAGVTPDHAERPAADRSRWENPHHATAVAATPVPLATTPSGFTNPCRPPVRDLSQPTYAPALGVYLAGQTQREQAKRDFARNAQELAKHGPIRERD